MEEASPVFWKSEQCLIAQNDIERLLPTLLRAERREWVDTYSPVTLESSKSGSNPLAGGTENAGVGVQILRHGNLVKETHAYFRRFEPHRYLSTLTNKKKKPTPDSSIRVVNNGAAGEQPAQAQAGKSESQRQHPDQPFHEKSPEYALYEKALLCAMYPVLGTTQSSPYSPSPSPVASPTSPNSRRSFRGGRPLLSSPPIQGKPRRFSFSAERACVSPEVSVPIDSEVLKELVRKAFGLNVNMHKFYMKKIERKNAPKTPERLLIDELLMQLSMLESNHHPFYRVHAFMDRNAYNEWLICQKEKVHALMKSFWHHPQPAIPALPLNLSERHTEYHRLMLRLIRHESSNKQPHPVYHNVTPSAPLSVETCRLLQEFSLRFGVGELYCKIVYLRYLVQYFENELWYMEHVTAVLNSVMDLVPVCQEILVKQEFAVLLEVLGLVQKHARYSLTRIKRLFPNNSPQGGVATLVHLLVTVLEAADFLRTTFPSVFSSLLEARSFLEELDDEPMDCLLPKYLQEEMSARYERGKVRAMDELNAQFLTRSVSPQLLNMLILNIRDEVHSYCACYQREFARYFSLEELAAVTFYQRLMVDVDELVSNPCARNVRRDKLDVCMLSLAFRLAELDHDWEKYIPLSSQTWREPFLAFANTWLETIGCRLQGAVAAAIQKDEWRELPMEEDKKGEGEATKPKRVPRRASGLLSSYPPLTPSKHSAFRVVATPPSPAKDSKLGARSTHCHVEASAGGPRSRKPARRRLRPEDSGSSSDENSAPAVHTVTAEVYRRSGRQLDAQKAGRTAGETGQTSLGTSENQFSQGSPEGGVLGGSSRALKVNAGEDGGVYSRVERDTTGACDALLDARRQESGMGGAEVLDVSNICDEGGKDSAEKSDAFSERSLLGETGDVDQAILRQSEREEQMSPDVGDRDVGEKRTARDEGSSCLKDKAPEQSIVKEHEDRSVERQNPASSDVGDLNICEKPNVLEGPGEESAQGLVDQDLSGSKECEGHGNRRNGNEQVSVGQGRSSDDQRSGDKKTEPHASECEDHENRCTRLDRADGGDSARSSPLSSESTEYDSYSDSIHSSDSFNFIEDHWMAQQLGTDSPVNFSVEVNSGTSKPTPRGRRRGNGAKTTRMAAPQPQWANDEPDAAAAEPLGVSDARGGLQNLGAKCAASRDCGSCSTETPICQEIKDKVGPIEETPSAATETDGESRRGVSRATRTSHAQREERARRLSASLDVSRPDASWRRNRLFAGVAASDTSSFKSASTSYESFRSPVGSLRTARDMTSSSESVVSNYESGLAKPSEGFRETKTGHLSPEDSSASGGSPRQAVLPVSSSFVDVICVVNRLVSFACHVCNILCPGQRIPRGDQPVSVGVSPQPDDVRALSGLVKQELSRKVLQVLSSLLKLYGAGVMRMELCGLAAARQSSLVGDAVLSELQAVAGNPRCWTCRNHSKSRPPCNATHPTTGKQLPPCEALRKAKHMPGGCEPATKEMAIRITNLVALQSLLPWMRNYVQESISHPELLNTGFYGNGMASDRSWTYCQFGPSLDGKKEQSELKGTASSGSGGEAVSDLCDAGEVDGCAQLLQRLEVAQIKLLTYRMNKFFKKILKALLNLELPTFEVSKHFEPALEFLQRELSRFSRVLYPDSFHALLVNLWLFVAQDLNELTDSLKDMKSQAPKQAMLIIQVTGMPVLKHLELYNTPTDRLIYMYRWLYKQVLVKQRQYRADEFVSSVSTTSHNSAMQANSPADFLIQSLCDDLHKERKCFSGTVLVDWVRDYVRCNGYDNLGIYIGNDDTNTGVELGSYLLQRKLMVCVAPPPQDGEEDVFELGGAGEEEGVQPVGGQVYYPGDSPAERLNNIVVQPGSSKSSTPRPSSLVAATLHSYDSDDLESASSTMFNQVESMPSEESVFYNRSDAFYSFINDEEVDSGEFRFKLDFADRLNVQSKLTQIICVLHTRKDTDRIAKNYLKKIPSGQAAEALGEEQTCNFFFCL